MKRKRIVGKIVYHILVSIGAFIMVYPLLWMVMSSFKETNTIFTRQVSLFRRNLRWRIIETAGRGSEK